MRLISVMFDRLGPYHHARLRAAAERAKVTAIEMATLDHTYGWDVVAGVENFRRVTLFPDRTLRGVSGREIAGCVESALADIRPELIAIPGWSSPAALAALNWALGVGVPAIMMSASTAHDQPRKRLTEAVKGRVVQLCSAALVGGQDHVTYLAALGMPCERIFTGYNVVDNAHFATGADTIRTNSVAERERLSLPERFFLASSRFLEIKNLPLLLKAYATYRHLAECSSNVAAGSAAWKLVLLGDGDQRGLLMRVSDELKLTNHVFMLGFKQYDELPPHYGLSGAFVLASTTEPWGLVVNEAMAAGLPVLVSNRCGCAQDLVHEDRNGWTFDPLDVQGLARLMLRVSSKECDRAAMGQASREIISHWTPEVFAENLWKAAEAALAAPRPRASLFDRALLWALMRRNVGA